MLGGDWVRGQRDLTAFDIGAAVDLITEVRGLAGTATSVEGFLQSLTALVHRCFVVEGRTQTALVRAYGTTTLESLPGPERVYAQGLSPGELTGDTTCLALLGTSGTENAWNDRQRSANHLVLPLVDHTQVEQMPMIAGLLEQLGVDVQALTAGHPDVMVASVDASCQVFYVRQATGSPLIPDQEFVRDHGIVSAIGFGGGLPTGEVFAVVMFCTVAVPPQTADLFELVALAVRLAGLDMLLLPLFTGTRRPAPAVDDLTVLQSRVSFSQALLLTYEQIASTQVETVRTALARARYDAARATAMAAVAQGLTDVRSLQDVAGVLFRQGSSAVGADALSIAIVDDAGTAVDVTISGDVAEDVAAGFARLTLNDRLPTTFTARTGRVVILRDISLVDHGFADLDAVAAATQMQSMACVPMWSGERLIGALTCGWHSTYSFDDSALELMVALAAQTAQALERSRLRERERAHNEVLQRSLLTRTPEPDNCEIVARYQAAEQVAQVGGDWYDSFVQQDGATVLVIGDVIGHDTAAAAAMGQLRGLLRGIGWYSGSAPADLLCSVDAAMEGLLVQTTASCVVARLEQTEDERELGITQLRWSNAGHPPPVVLNPDGSSLVLSGSAPDLLLGIDQETTRVQSEVTLDRGSTVLLYTDGLVERRGEHLDQGLERLRAMLQQLAHLPLAELCDTLLDRLGPGIEDDIALLAVRLHRQDLPRPPEAGPERLPPVAPIDT